MVPGPVIIRVYVVYGTRYTLTRALLANFPRLPKLELNAHAHAKGLQIADAALLLRPRTINRSLAH